jgi:Multiubiquitin
MKTDHQSHEHPKKIEIKIDREVFHVTEQHMSGLQLRELPTPPIGPDHDLFEVVPGESDRKIEDTTIVVLHNGQRFFTAPAHINPGRR